MSVAELTEEFLAEVVPTARPAQITCVADDLSVHLPACHFVDYRADAGHYCLILQDLRHHQPGDQLGSCPLDKAAAALEELARLHTECLDKRHHNYSWLRPGIASEHAGRLSRLVATLTCRFIDRYAVHLDDAVIRLVRSLATTISSNRSPANTPVTVTHGDFRTDNLMFGPDRVAVLDWQTASLGAAMSDVSYFLGSSLSTLDRRKAERSLVAHYRDCAVAGGMSVNWKNCWNDYRRFSHAGLVMAITAGSLVAKTCQDEATFSTLAQRCGQQAIDLEAG